MITLFQKKHTAEAADIFLDIYSNPPFCFKWIDRESIFKYLDDITKCPNFMGFVLKDNEKITGACMGEAKLYFEKKIYFIHEIFIKRQLQSKGYGTEFLKNIEKRLRAINISVIELRTQKNMSAYNFYSKNNFREAKKTVYMLKSLLS